MRRRPSSRILLRNQENRVLLFQFEHRSGRHAGQKFWATPGGALEPGESPADAAHRELFEETGFRIDPMTELVRGREFALNLPNGENVIAEEYFFAARTPELMFPCDRQACWAAEGIVGFRWWSIEEIAFTKETIFPDDLAELLALVGSIAPKP
jgi:8-oxo-dGTP pyrophosphatase MutT (NUDIX family)